MLEFRVLGPFEVARDGEVLRLRGMRRQSVLAMLVMEAGRVVSVGRLVEGVWGEDPPETAATALHGHVSHLRRAIGDVIVTRAPGYMLDVDAGAVDVGRFETLLERAHGELAAGRPAGARRILDEALRLWRGSPLEDLADAPFTTLAVPRWRSSERARARSGSRPSSRWVAMRRWLRRSSHSSRSIRCVNVRAAS